MTTFTVTATEAGSTSSGIALMVSVLTGQSGTQPGATPSATQVTPNLAVTPAATGSLVFGSLLALAGTFTVNGSTTNDQDAHSIAGLEMCSFHGTATTTAASPVTLGYTSATNGISICLCEIRASGTLAIDGSTPAGVSDVAAITVTTASFTPPGASLLVAAVQSNGAASVTTMGITDTSGLGLTWTEQVKQAGAGNGYSGIWTAAVPGGVTPPPVMYSMRMMP